MDGTQDRGSPQPLGKPRRFLGASSATSAVHRLIDRAARVDSTVLITGESGVGKEIVAREIHERSERAGQAFVALNCSAIPETLIESELFGSEKGAFTDAAGLRRGAFERADRGTLFLDEVGDLSRMAQPKLLRAVESGEILRVGGEQPQWVDLRIIAATNQHLARMCREKRFRMDLYWRLRVIEIRVPPLRHRRDDVRVLADHFAREIAASSGRPFTGITEPALRALEAHSWPGNVRELRSVVERALALCSGNILDEGCFDLNPVSTPIATVTEQDWRTARGAFEVSYVKNLLRSHSGNVTEAARSAGLATGSLYKMLRRLGMRQGRDASGD